ncbi:hypothetical protein NDU88_004326 [Pleurodeles waltl]|uniref:Uncharacterized protein n=1 Tax=Pleurodeles waltl TaxID=8319 RepID=A0AAV7NLX5_PLEWA|nr:hypothetical protein NDU88_004326 [Pleurodeles waltl]
MPLTRGRERWINPEADGTNQRSHRAITNVGMQPQADIYNEGTQDIRGMANELLKPFDKKTHSRNSKELSPEDDQATTRETRQERPHRREEYELV